MAIGPVQLIVLGFNHPHFHGEIINELERLRESDTVRVIDSLAVYKDANGELEIGFGRVFVIHRYSPPFPVRAPPQRSDQLRQAVLRAS